MFKKFQKLHLGAVKFRDVGDNQYLPLLNFPSFDTKL